MNRGASRHGLSLIEIVVVMALMGLIGSAVASTLLHQQRFAGDTVDLLEGRSGVRDAIEVMSADIRGSSAADTIRLMADSAIELFANIGSAVICRPNGSGFVLAEESVRGNTLSSFLLYPDTGDVALIYGDSADAAGSRWHRHRIASFAARPTSTSCLADGAGPMEGFALTLLSAPHVAAGRGAPVRFVRRGRYSLYRSSDRDWYLGYRRCNAAGTSVCGAIQPVSGPYRPYSANGAETGLLFNYFDARDDSVGPGAPLTVARVDITARAPERSRRLMRTSSRSALPPMASRSIAIRNR